jgi:hypothetical protein
MLRLYTRVARFSSDAVFVPRLSPLVVISGVYPFLDHLARWAFLPVFLSIKEVRNGNWCREVVQR